MPDSCKNCFFAWKNPSQPLDVELSLCRRYPPTLTGRAGFNIGDAAFPIVTDGVWCGEWTPRAEEPRPEARPEPSDPHGLFLDEGSA